MEVISYPRAVNLTLFAREIEKTEAHIFGFMKKASGNYAMQFGIT